MEPNVKEHPATAEPTQVRHIIMMGDSLSDREALRIKNLCWAAFL